MGHDLDDRISWLEKAGTADRVDKAELAAARGQKALQESRDADAVQLFTEALVHFGSMPESPVILNNSALVHFSLFQVSADHEELAKGIAKMEKAISLDPRNSILADNAADAILSNALWEIVGTDVDRKTLRAPGSWELLAFLYADKAGRDRYVGKVRAHPAIAKVKELWERELVLAPKKALVYLDLAALYSYCDDVDGLKQLAARLKETEIDLADGNRLQLEYLRGKSDAKAQADTRAALTLQEKVVQKAREIKGVTLAVALGNLARLKIGAAALDLKAESAGSLELAEEAHGLAPSQATRSLLIKALLHRAHTELIATDPVYAQWAAQCRRSLHGVTLIPVVLAEDVPSRKSCLANADVQRRIGNGA